MNRNFRYEMKRVSYNGVEGQIAVRYAEYNGVREYDALYEHRQMVDFRRNVDVYVNGNYVRRWGE